MDTDVAIQARLAMARGAWREAAEQLRTALRREPAHVELHYRLAICASHLGAAEEAVREFGWVATHAAAESDEARVARAWLSETRPSPAARVATTIASNPEPVRGVSALSGTVTWVEPGGAPQPRAGHLLVLMGLEGTSTMGAHYRIRTNREGGYRFKDVIPGPYQLTDAGAGPPMWRLRVALEPEHETILDLSADNGATVRDDFPERGVRSARLAARTAPPQPRSDGETTAFPPTATDTTEGN